jgi:hypothetical protein
MNSRMYSAAVAVEGDDCPGCGRKITGHEEDAPRVETETYVVLAGRGRIPLRLPNPPSTQMEDREKRSPGINDRAVDVQTAIEELQRIAKKYPEVDILCDSAVSNLENSYPARAGWYLHRIELMLWAQTKCSVVEDISTLRSVVLQTKWKEEENNAR